jgi:DNA modification methylase
MREYYNNQGITIYHGDCLEVMKHLEDKSFDVALTSPPYNRKRNDKYTEYDDTIKDYFDFLCKSIDLLERKTNRNVFFNIQKNYYNSKEVYQLFGHYAEKIAETIVWTKSNPMPASGFSITNSYEFIIAFGSTLKSNTTYTKNHIQTSVAKMLAEHKAMMHPSVAEFIIDKFCTNESVVLDPFAGCGTTLLACKSRGIRGVGIELSERYCEIMAERLEANRIEEPLLGIL